MNDKKIILSNKIHPYFYGLTGDLMFWIVLNTVFLTTVKGIDAVQINLMTMIGTLVSIVIHLNSIKIIRKIGNINSIRLGTFLLLLSSILLVVANSFWVLVIGEIFYLSSYSFKQMDSVVLMKNLTYLNKKDDYIKIQSKSSIVYSMATMIVALTSGYLFSINNYLPMIICIGICLFNFVFSFLIYEVDYEEEKIENKSKVKITKLVLSLIVLYGIFYSTISIGQGNAKLFMQENMSNYLDANLIAIYISYFVVASRLIRLVSDVFFLKVYNKLKDNIIYLMGIILIFSFVFLLFGSYLPGIQAAYVMAIGFVLMFVVIDPFENYLLKILLDKNEPSTHDKLIMYYSLSRKIGELIFSGFISIILVNWNYNLLMLIMLILSISYMIPIIRFKKLLSAKE